VWPASTTSGCSGPGVVPAHPSSVISICQHQAAENWEIFGRRRLPESPSASPPGVLYGLPHAPLWVSVRRRHLEKPYSGCSGFTCLYCIYVQDPADSGHHHVPSSDCCRHNHCSPGGDLLAVVKGWSEHRLTWGSRHTLQGRLWDCSCSLHSSGTQKSCPSPP